MVFHFSVMRIRSAWIFYHDLSVDKLEGGKVKVQNTFISKIMKIVVSVSQTVCMHMGFQVILVPCFRWMSGINTCSERWVHFIFRPLARMDAFCFNFISL